MYTQIEVIQGLIKSEYVDGKINTETAKELLRLLDELKTEVINNKYRKEI